MTLEYHLRCAWLEVTNPPIIRLLTWRQSWLAHVAICVMMSASLRLFRRGWWQMGHSRISTTCSSLVLMFRSSRSSISPSSPGVLSSGTEIVDVSVVCDSDGVSRPSAGVPVPECVGTSRFLTLSASGSMFFTRSATPCGRDLACNWSSRQMTASSIVRSSASSLSLAL